MRDVQARRGERDRQLRTCAAALAGVVLVGVSVAAGARWGSLAGDAAAHEHDDARSSSLASIGASASGHAWSPPAGSEESRVASEPGAAMTLTPGDVRDIHHLARLKMELSENADQRRSSIDESPQGDMRARGAVNRKGAVLSLLTQPAVSPHHASSGTAGSAPHEVDQHEPQAAELVDHNSKDAALLARLKAQLHTLNLEQRHLDDSSYVQQGADAPACARVANVCALLLKTGHTADASLHSLTLFTLACFPQARRKPKRRNASFGEHNSTVSHENKHALAPNTPDSSHSRGTQKPSLPP